MWFLDRVLFCYKGKHLLIRFEPVCVNVCMSGSQSGQFTDKLDLLLASVFCTSANKVKGNKNNGQ